MKEDKHKSLGRGLEALLGEDLLSDDEIMPVTKDNNFINIDEIKVGEFQPRKDFDEDAIKALSESIKEKGVLQPLIVRESMFGYELIAGERRLRASKLAGLTEVPVIVKNLSDNEVLEIALVENLLRENLSAIEEAEGYQNLMNKFSYTQEKVSSIVGKSRSYIANTTRLLSLPDEIKDLVSSGKLSAGHARCLIGLDNAISLAQKIISNDYSVRETEALVAKQKQAENPKTEKSKPSKTKNLDIVEIEDRLKEKLGLRINITPSKQGGGKVVLQYASVAELDMILDILEAQKKSDLAVQNTVFKPVEETKDEKFSIKFVE